MHARRDLNTDLTLIFQANLDYLVLLNFLFFSELCILLGQTRISHPPEVTFSPFYSVFLFRTSSLTHFLPTS